MQMVVYLSLRQPEAYVRELYVDSIDDIYVVTKTAGKINVHVRETLSPNPDKTKSVGPGIFFGLGKIAIGVIADDVVDHKKGLQLFIFTIKRNLK